MVFQQKKWDQNIKLEKWRNKKMKKWYMAVIAAAIGLGGCRDKSREQTRMYEATKPVVYQVQKAPPIEQQKREVSPVKTSLEETVGEYEEEIELVVRENGRVNMDDYYERAGRTRWKSFVFTYDRKKDKAVAVPGPIYRKAHPEYKNREYDEDCECPY